MLAQGLSAVDDGDMEALVGEPDIDGLVHDLRGPLSVIVAFAESLDGVGREERARFAARLVANAHRALAVLEEFSALCDLRAGETELALRPMDLGDLLQRACEDIAPELRRGVEMTCMVPEDGVLMMGDRDILGMAVRAALRRIVRSVGKPSRLRLIAAGEGDFACFELHTGRLDERDGTPQEMELDGLEILRRVVALHGGRVVFDQRESDALFRVSLPRQPR